MKIEALEEKIAELEAQLSVQKAINRDLLTALEAQERFDIHWMDCGECEEDSDLVCEGGARLMEEALTLRKAVMPR